ncbi:hypothetical protein ACTI_63900 [Actinoplanes sp. OR16]|uniref:hypothetical protein n=1 Tax=Actinoplanes sp. OR16 TaxID=946334 RepID=UPI000F6F8B6A|nr:hypothetical protein [Actinoplanes sp. OR16]BBH69705.1 hypothetical protein ACTI_63900 [Actinoplanes sp. OR16]
MHAGLHAAVSFVATHARILERRRLDHLLNGGPADAVLAALDAYRNPDGGYGWALEPDLRSATSQPVGAMHALEVIAETGDASRLPALLDWLAAHANDDGGMAFSLPFTDQEGCAPHWTAADPASSVTMTTQLAAHAHRAGAGDHPWLRGATAWCLDTMEAITEAPHAIELMFSMLFLDAVAGETPRATALLERYTGFVRLDGPTPVAGGAEGEVLFPLDFTPHDDSPSRAYFSPAAIAADRERLAAQQQPDGGWDVSFQTFSPAAALEWRGYATVQAITVLGTH